MSNANVPAGLSPISDNGTPWSGQGMLVAFASGDSNNIFIGDPLVPAGGVDAFGVPYVTIASAGATDVVVGSFVGVANGPAKGYSAAYTLTQDKPIYRQASVANYGFITTNPDQLFAIQEDSVGGAIAITTGGFANGNLISGAGSTQTGLSGWMLDSSTVASGNSTYQLKVLGLLRGPDNAIGNYAKWIVRLNLPALAPSTAGY